MNSTSDPDRCPECGSDLVDVGEAAPENVAIPRQLPEGGIFAYAVYGEAWYARSLTEKGRAKLSVMSSNPNGGEFWSVTIREVQLTDWTIKVEIFGDALQALTQVPDLFEALRAERPRRLNEVRIILDRLGAIDKTPRRRPWWNRRDSPSWTRAADGGHRDA